MTLKIAKRGVVPPFLVMDVLRDALNLEAAGRSVIHLEVGQPSTGIPKAALAKIDKALNDDILGYTMAAGRSPSKGRSRCGTIRPTKPMPPATAAPAPTARATPREVARKVAPHVEGAARVWLEGACAAVG